MTKESAIMKAVSKRKSTPITVSEMVDRTGIPRRTIQEYLLSLTMRDEVKRIDLGRNKYGYLPMVA